MTRARTATDGPTRREQLVHLRATLLEAIEGATPRDLPALSRELRLVMVELEMVGSLAEGTPAEEIAIRRAARRSDPAADGPSRRSQPRRRGVG